MDQEGILKELDRILEALKAVDDPGSDEYKSILQSYERLYKVCLADSKDRNDQSDQMHRQELEKKKLEIEERRLALEEKKLEATKENETVRIEFETKKLELEREKARLESRRIDIQEGETNERLRIEDKKADATIEENRNHTRYTKKQAIGRLLEIGAEGIIMFAGIVLTGRVSDGVILDKNMWSLIRKVK